MTMMTTTAAMIIVTNPLPFEHIGKCKPRDQYPFDQSTWHFLQLITLQGHQMN
jgi:hypothetical protein